MRWNLLVAGSLGAALAGCAGDRPERAGHDDPAANDAAADAGYAAEEPYPGARLPPAESAAAVARQQAHADSVTRAVRGADVPATPPFVDTPERQYASCMAQARSVEEPVRSTIREACERQRAAHADAPRE